MSSDDKQNDWSQDPSLSGIDFARLQACLLYTSDAADE